MIEDADKRARQVVRAAMTASATGPVSRPDPALLALWDGRWSRLLAATASGSAERLQVVERALTELAGAGDRAVFEAAAASLAWVGREHRIAPETLAALVDRARLPLLEPREREAIVLANAVREAEARWTALVETARIAVERQTLPAVWPLPSGKALQRE